MAYVDNTQNSTVHITHTIHAFMNIHDISCTRVHVHVACMMKLYVRHEMKKISFVHTYQSNVRVLPLTALCLAAASGACCSASEDVGM